MDQISFEEAVTVYCSAAVHRHCTHTYHFGPFFLLIFLQHNIPSMYIHTKFLGNSIMACGVVDVEYPLRQFSVAVIFFTTFITT